MNLSGVIMGLSKRQIKGIKGSIKKWVGIKEGKVADEKGSNCLLCKMYAKNSCSFCPASIKVGIGNCCKTPYWDVRDHLHGHHFGGGGFRDMDCQECDTLIDAEIDFLKSLLPEG
jgi:hypothetical protein